MSPTQTIDNHISLYLACIFILYYRVRAIISHGLYTFYPILEDYFFVFKEVFSENSVFMYG